MKWYVLHVMTGEEITVRDKLQDLPGANALVPKRKIIERHRGIAKEVVRILFPSYVFVRMELDGENYYAAKGIPGVYKFLGPGRPVAVPDNQMANVLRWCDGKELVGLSRVEIGKEIKVIEGPLKGMEGQIIRIDKRKGRAKVKITLFREVKEIDLGIEIIQASK